MAGPAIHLARHLAASATGPAALNAMEERAYADGALIEDWRPVLDELSGADVPLSGLYS